MNDLPAADRSAPELLWQPDPDQVAGSRIAAFRAWLATQRQVQVSDYAELWRWSVDEVGPFWAAVADFCAVRFHQRAAQALGNEQMPGAEWFCGATLNYAEHALLGAGKDDDRVAVIAETEDGRTAQLTFGELRAQVAAVRAGLVELGVRRGDRVAALAPNSPETLVCFLAAASLGAVWSSCSPDFGARAVVDRFSQIEPVLLLAVDGYTYNGKRHQVAAVVETLRAALPSLRATVLVPYLDPDPNPDQAPAGTAPARPAAEPAATPAATPATRPDDPDPDGLWLAAGHPVVRWGDLLARHEGAPLAFAPVPFAHPLWVLYSSGTTGLPKGIVQGHGGIVLEHLKMMALQQDLGPGDRFFWFTTTGWMMWNYLVAGLLVGATIVLFDGSPGYPDLSTLWRLAERHKVTYFGTSAPYLQACLKEGLRPAEQFDLSALRTVGSTGAPLPPEGFRWVVDSIGAPVGGPAGSPGAGPAGHRVQVVSTSGGTDLCTAFVGGSVDVPVWLGELSCRQLGAAVAAFDEAGREVTDEVGELVITKPMPSMPVSFWDDPDGSRLREAYFATYPGVWRHGDWIKITSRGSAVIYGRSDSTLNRGGVRMGTSEFYRVVEASDEVVDSLVIDTSGAGEADGQLLCFLALADGVELAAVEPGLRQALRRELSPRHVPDRFIVVAEVPRTLNGKKCEVPVKKILAGLPTERAVSAEALRNPDSLAPFVALAATLAGRPG